MSQETVTFYRDLFGSVRAGISQVLANLPGLYQEARTELLSVAGPERVSLWVAEQADSGRALETLESLELIEELNYRGTDLADIRQHFSLFHLAVLKLASAKDRVGFRDRSIDQGATQVSPEIEPYVDSFLRDRFPKHGPETVRRILEAFPGWYRATIEGRDGHEFARRFLSSSNRLQFVERAMAGQELVSGPYAGLLLERSCRVHGWDGLARSSAHVMVQRDVLESLRGLPIFTRYSLEIKYAAKTRESLDEQAVSPRINGRTAGFYIQLFVNANAGLAYACEAFRVQFEEMVTSRHLFEGFAEEDLEKLRNYAKGLRLGKQGAVMGEELVKKLAMECGRDSWAARVLDVVSGMSRLERAGVELLLAGSEVNPSGYWRAILERPGKWLKHKGDN